MTGAAINSRSNLEMLRDKMGDDIVLRLGGLINVDSSPNLRDCLQAILSEQPLPRSVIVDLASVAYVEISGIATLIEALKIARHHKVRFCLQGLRGSVLRLFEVAGVLPLFDSGDPATQVS